MDENDIRLRVREDRGEHFTRIHIEIQQPETSESSFWLSGYKAELALELLNIHASEIKLEFAEKRILFVVAEVNSELASLIEILHKIQTRIFYNKFCQLKDEAKCLKDFRCALAPYIAEMKLLGGKYSE